MSLLVRAPRLAMRSRTFVPSRGVHGYKHMPFDYSKKGVFGVKLATYMLVGFLAPFGACAYQLSKQS